MHAEPRPIRAVAFDLDGTLVDSAADIGHAVNTALSAAGLQRFDPARVRSWIGDGPDALIARALEAQGVSTDDPALRQALPYHPRSDALLNNLAHLVAEAGRLEEALALADSAVTLAGPHQATARETRDEIRRRLDTGAR
jgi:phosphoglycolate phosphatase-like HAD superfamily hydrolase